MANKTPPAQINPPERHDPYKMRSLEQILTLFDGGAFLTDLMERHQGLMQELMDHLEEHGPKGCQGSMQITIEYAGGSSVDLTNFSTAAAALLPMPMEPVRPRIITAPIRAHGRVTRR